MSDTTASEPEAAKTPQTPRMQVLGQYIRDLSFENVVSQSGDGANAQPEISIGVNLEAKKRDEENRYEVIQTYKIEAKAKDGGATLFLLELDYGGVFQIENVPDSQIHPYLLIECPRMLFPYVRRIVGDVTRDGGFPPLNMESVDFVRLYQNELQKRAASKATNGG